MITIKDTLRTLRTRKKMSQKEAAKALGMSESYYVCIENIDYKLMEKLAKFYGVKPSDIELPVSNT